jgi:hypothetical protein
MTRDEIREILANHLAKVTFTKKDGSRREMICTLIAEALPELVGSKAKKSMEVLPVWDMEKEAWRSFRIDSVEKVEVLD